MEDSLRAPAAVFFASSAYFVAETSFILWCGRIKKRTTLQNSFFRALALLGDLGCSDAAENV
jgi:hypothetical protein